MCAPSHTPSPPLSCDVQRLPTRPPRDAFEGAMGTAALPPKSPRRWGKRPPVRLPDDTPEVLMFLCCLLLLCYGEAPYTTPRGKGEKVPTCWPSAGREQVRLRAESTPPSSPTSPSSSLPPLFSLSAAPPPRARAAPALPAARSSRTPRSAQLPLARSLALQCSTHRHTGACFSARSLARSPLARPLSACSLARSLARSLTATHRHTGVTVRHGLLVIVLRTARSLASSPLDRSLSARWLARSPLAL